MAADLFYRVGVSAAAAKYDLSDDVCSLTLEERESKPTKLTVDLLDPFKVFGYALQDGMDVEVELGTADDHSLAFHGRIYQVDAAFPEAGAARVTMIAYDRLMAMGLKPRSRAFANQQLSAVVAAVARPHAPVVTVSVDGDPTFGLDGVRQRDETDLAFLLRLACEFGCKMYVATDGDTFVFKGQKAIMEAEPDVALYHGRCDVEHRLVSFTPSSDLTSVELPRAISGIDFETGALASVSVSTLPEVRDEEDAFVDENLSAFRKRYPELASRLEALIGAAPAVRKTLQREMGASVRQAVPTFASEADVKQRLKNQFSAQRHGMRASGATLGNHHLHAQRTARVLHIGGRFSGLWFLTLVRHTVNRTGFRTEFECTR